jgi:hypothetical protein
VMHQHQSLGIKVDPFSRFLEVLSSLHHTAIEYHQPYNTLNPLFLVPFVPLSICISFLLSHTLSAKKKPAIVQSNSPPRPSIHPSTSTTCLP